MQAAEKTIGQCALRWARRTPVNTFIFAPLAVIAFELAINRGQLTFVPWGLLLMAWGYLQYRLCGNYRQPKAGGTSGMDEMPNRVIDTGIYGYTRNPMYLGHIIFMTGLAITFWSWFALILLAARAAWFHFRVLKDEERLEKAFGADYANYKTRVKRWIPYVI